MADKKNYCFVRLTVDQIKNIRVFRVLPFQSITDNAGNTITLDTSKSIAGGAAEKIQYDLGTIFAVEKILPVAGGNYAVIGPFSPVNTGSLLFASKPDKEIEDAWTEYTRQHPNYDEAPSPVASAKPADKGTKAHKTEFEKITEKAIKVCADLDKDGFWVDPAIARTLIANIQLKRNTMLVGPTGCGKTEMVMRLAEKLGTGIRIFDMGSMYDPMSQMLGTHRLTVDEKTGQTRSTFEYAQFVEAVQQPGIVLLDELTRSDPGVLNILFPCLDSRRTLPVEMAGEKDLRNIKIHPDCVFVATANVGAQYTGTKNRGQLDAALEDRFAGGKVELGYSPRDKETAFLVKRTGCQSSDADIVTSVCLRVREKSVQNIVSRALSVRESLAACELCKLGWPVLEAMNQVFLPLFDGQGVNSERDTVRIIIQSK